MWKFNVFNFAFLVICARNVLCVSESERDQMIETFGPIAKECLDECGVEDFDPKEKPDNPCLNKCFLTKIKVIDDQGMIDPEVVRKSITDFIENEDEAKKIVEIFDKCFEEKIDNTTEGAEADAKRIDDFLKCFHGIHH